jgi:hypothetical protein
MVIYGSVDLIEMLNKMIKYQFKKIMESKMGNWLIKKP